jgi:hypothetical protein
VGFYVALWPLIDEPLARFQVGLLGTWITPDNYDNTSTPRCPERTLARKWKERGPTWSQIAKLFNYPFLYGRGLDTRPGIAGGGAMEINTVPRFEAEDSNGRIYDRLPKLPFPVDEEGRSILVQEVTYYS